MAFTQTTLHPPCAAPSTGPTKAEMFGYNQDVVDVTKGLSGDTTLVITHNMNIPTAVLAQGFPEVSMEPTALGFFASAPYVSAKDANTVTITMATGQTGQLLRVRIRRPQSLAK